MNKKIILASRSKARQSLLKQIGIPFIVTHSSIRESRKIKTNCSDLVISNAMRKAKDVSSRLSSGIIIGADTVVFAGKTIIGKPKNIKDAARTLRLLSRKPQLVYTGIALFDLATKAILTDYEKTKVFLYPLSDNQIMHYIKKVRPFDKAGSFDIQGRGAMFVKRIEGCYTNVVGLPVAKLVRMLELIGYQFK